MLFSYFLCMFPSNQNQLILSSFFTISGATNEPSFGITISRLQVIQDYKLLTQSKHWKELSELWIYWIYLFWISSWSILKQFKVQFESSSRKFIAISYFWVNNLILTQQDEIWRTKLWSHQTVSQSFSSSGLLGKCMKFKG